MSDQLKSLNPAYRPKSSLKTRQRIKNKKYKRILVIATGSLQSPTLTNQSETIPGIAHAISLEVLS